jgi:hypothetical protein
LRFDGVGGQVIQALKPAPRILRHELTDYEWAAIKSMLPNKPRGAPRDVSMKDYPALDLFV